MSVKNQNNKNLIGECLDVQFEDFAVLNRREEVSADFIASATGESGHVRMCGAFED